MAEITVTKDNFLDEVLKCEEMPVLLDFWASWCGPCMRLSSVLSSIAEEYKDKVKVGKINVDEQQELAGKFGIQSIPFLVVMKNGMPVAHSVGYRDKKDILQLLNL